jgi:O-antigen/teichoic acid export membrane protein
MRSDNKRIVKNTIFLYVRMVVLIFINLIVSRLVLQLLGADDYGLYQVVGGIVLIFSVVNGALSAGSSRFITVALGKGDAEELKKVFNTSFECHLMLSFLILILCETIGLWYVNKIMVIPDGRMTAANWLFQFSVLSCFLSITQVPYSADIIAHERMDVYAYMGLGEGFYKLLLVGLLFLFNNADLLILYGALMCTWNVFAQIFYRFFCYKLYPETHLTIVKDKPLLKKILSFSFWDVVGNFSATGNTQGVNLLINKFFGVVYNAAYGITNQVNNVLNQFVSNFMTAVNPQITKDYARGEIGKMKELVYMSSKMAFVLFSLVGIPFLMESDYILDLWLKDVPDKTSVFLRFAIIYGMIRSFAKPVVTAVHASGNIKWLNIYAGGVSVVTVIPLTLLAYLGGMPIESGYYVLILSGLLSNLAELYCLHREIHEYGVIDYLKKVYVPCITISLIAIGLDYLIVRFFDASFVRFVCTTCANAVIIGILTLAVLMTKAQRRSFLSSVFEKLHIHKQNA